MLLSAEFLAANGDIIRRIFRFFFRFSSDFRLNAKTNVSLISY